MLKHDTGHLVETGSESCGWPWPTANAPYGGSVLARLTPGDLNSGLEGAESAKQDETPWSIYDGPLATA